jgi:hypothetical protein
MFLGLGTMHGKAMELLGGMPHEQEGTIGSQRLSPHTPKAS